MVISVKKPISLFSRTTLIHRTSDTYLVSLLQHSFCIRWECSGIILWNRNMVKLLYTFFIKHSHALQNAGSKKTNFVCNEEAAIFFVTWNSRYEMTSSKNLSSVVCFFDVSTVLCWCVPVIHCVQSLLLPQNFSVLLPVMRDLGELVHIACDGWKSCDASRVYNNKRPIKHMNAWTSGWYVVWCLNATFPTEIEGLRVLDLQQWWTSDNNAAGN